MPYLIDGHNLIPKIAGLNLSDADDEERLLARLQEFCRRQRKRVEVFFDNAPLGSPRQQRLGWVTAHFVPQGRSADQAIRQRLSKLGREARTWTVVSSDGQVRSAARAAGARLLSAEQFASLLNTTLSNLSSRPSQAAAEEEPAGMSAEELEEWLRLFGEG